MMGDGDGHGSDTAIFSYCVCTFAKTRIASVACNRVIMTSWHTYYLRVGTLPCGPYNVQEP
jgi:hypothetical protein